MRRLTDKNDVLIGEVRHWTARSLAAENEVLVRNFSPWIGMHLIFDWLIDWVDIRSLYTCTQLINRSKQWTLIQSTTQTYCWLIDSSNGEVFGCRLGEWFPPAFCVRRSLLILPSFFSFLRAVVWIGNKICGTFLVGAGEIGQVSGANCRTGKGDCWFTRRGKSCFACYSGYFVWCIAVRLWA